MSRPSGVRLAAEVRHQSVLIARDPGPLIGYTIMGLLLISATRPLYAALSQFGLESGESGIDRAAAGMAVMFSLFALKVGAAQLLNERTCTPWTRSGPARPASRDPRRQVAADPGRDRRPAGAAVRVRGRRLRAPPPRGLVGPGRLRPGLVRLRAVPRHRRLHPRPQPGPAQRRRRRLRPAHHRPRRRHRPGQPAAGVDARGGPRPHPATGRSTPTAPPWPATRASSRARWPCSASSR